MCLKLRNSPGHKPKSPQSPALISSSSGCSCDLLQRNQLGLSYRNSALLLDLFGLLWEFSWWTSVIAQLVKNLPLMQETLLQFLGLEDPLEKWLATEIQSAWASLMAQLVKNLPSVWETWVGKMLWRRERLPTPVFWPWTV